MPSPKMQPHSPHTPDTKSYTAKLSPSSMLMRPPMTDYVAVESCPTDLSVGTDGFNVSTSNMSTLHVPPIKRNSISLPGRAKKLRFVKHASVAGMNETKVDDIATDIIIPRERVVSICNMDKDALDDYLNEGGDSQEQEAELLQYFQTNSGGDKSGHNHHTPSTITTTSTNATTTITSSANEAIPVPTTSAYPILENYQLHQNAGLGTTVTTASSQMPHGLPAEQSIPNKQHQIDELRQYLQQNLHHPAPSSANDDDRTVTSSSQMSSVSLPYGNRWKESMESSASIPPSLYQQTASDQSPVISGGASIISKRRLMHHEPQQVSPQLMRSISATSTVTQPQQSPNSRHKNFSFVPISPGPQSPRVITQTQATNNLQHLHGSSRNTFLSPRRSPAVRKLTNRLQDPSITGFDNTFAAKHEISASAPVSPSITPHHFQFNNSMAQPYTTTANTIQMGLNQQAQQQQPHQHQASCAVSGCPALENRSQSVPLHCQSPAFNQTMPNTAYNSVCNSVAQTPVPSEYADFTEDNLLDMLAETPDEPNIKMETGDMMNADLNSNIRATISRSVPSTPLPTIPNYRMNAISSFNNVSNTNPNVRTASNASIMAKNSFDMSKSVPTTPILMSTNTTPFRYSPEHHRDFLINGNTVDNNTTKTNQFFPIGMQQHQADSLPSSQNTSPHSIIQGPQQPALVSSTQSSSQIMLSATTQSIDDLTNYNVNDPIVESSDLMNNL